VGRYLVIYRVREDAVEIVNVVYGSRDVDAMF
jgi:plasmid stabilization system protein ParE